MSQNGQTHLSVSNHFGTLCIKGLKCLAHILLLIISLSSMGTTSLFPNYLLFIRKGFLVF